MTRKLSTLAFGLALCAAQAWAQGAPGPGGRGGAPQGPQPVGVVSLEKQQVPVTVTLPGRAVAFQQTVIRPQVGGELREIVYTPGQPVTAGAVLFKLDDASLAATLASSESAVTSAKAAVQGAQATVNRYDRLAGSGVSRAELESSQVALANAEAALSAAEVQRDLARLQLEHAQITSPIDGIPDIPQVSVGDIVTANQSDTLTTVTQMNPIYVDVSESRARILRHQEQRATGALSRNKQRPEAKLVFETGQEYGPTGAMVTPGVAVSATTGTVPIRFRFDNPNRMILPGQFVRLQIIVGTVEGVLVPQRATSRAPNGALTAFIAQDGKAKEITLTENGSYQNAWVVTSGAAAGDALIIDGLTNLRDGADVKTVPVTIDDQGVVREVAQAGTQDAPANTPAAASPAPAATGETANPAPAAAASETPPAEGTPTPATPAASAPDPEAPLPESTAPAPARPVPAPRPAAPASN